MGKMPKISVIMSVFNGEKYLRESVDSILNQTFVDFEFIIINDGSTDKTKALLDSCHDARIRVIHQKNIGLTESPNKGLGVALGGYIARMDADDISHVNRLEKEAVFLDANKGVGLVGTFGLRIDENGKEGHLLSFPTSDETLRRSLKYDCPFLHGSVMYRKECIEKAGVYRKKIGPAEDYDLWLRISEHFALANLDEPLYKYRVVSEGVSMSLRFNQVRATLFARKLANDRKAAGKDELDKMSYSDVEHTLDSLMSPTVTNQRMVLHAQYTYLADISYFAGDYASSFKWLFRSLLMRPYSWQSIVLVFKTFVSSILPQSMVRKIKGKYGIGLQRWNGRP